VTDKAGNESRETASFMYDAVSPEVEFAGISDKDIINKSRTVTLVSTDNIGTKEISCSVKKDGVEISNETKEGESFLYVPEIDGVYELTGFSKDAAGNVSETVSVSFTVDQLAPQADLQMHGSRYEDSGWFYDSVSFDLSANDTLSGIYNVSFRLNDKVLYTGNDPAKTISVKKKDMIDMHAAGGKISAVLSVTDKAGNEAKKTLEFLFDGVNPEAELSGIADGTITNKVPVVRLSGTDNISIRDTVIKVKRNGIELTPSPRGEESISYTPVNDGSYEITGYAVDTAGNKSAEQKLKFSLDRVDPAVKGFTHYGSKTEGYSWYNGAVRLKASLSDDFSGLSSSIVQVNDVLINEKNHSGNLSGDILDELNANWFVQNESESGKYTALLETEDRAGNSSSEEISFYADVLAPSISLSGIESGTFTSSTPSVKATVSDNYPSLNTIYFEVHRNGEIYKTSTHERSAEATFDDFDRDGDYKVIAWAIDRAGNQSAKKTLSFTKDTTAPVLALSGASEGQYYNTVKDITASVKERNYGNMTVTTEVTRTLDDKTENIGWSIKPTSADYKTSKKFAQTGTYKITIGAVDKAGNRAASKTLSFTVDTVKPEIKFTGIKKAVGYGDEIAPKAEYSDSYFANADISLSFDRGTPKASRKDVKTKNGGTTQYSGFAREKSYDGVYTLKCTVKDKAGNVASQTETFKINRFGSRWFIDAHAKDLQGTIVNSIDSGFTVTEVNVTGLASKKPKIMLDGESLPDADIKITEESSSSHKYSYKFGVKNFEKEGSYICSVSSTDTLGNFSELPSKKQVKFTLDKTPPVITVSGIDEEGNYESGKDLLNVTVSDNFAVGSFHVLAGREQVYESKDGESSAVVNLPKGRNMTIKVVAFDKAGNKTVEKINDVTVGADALGAGGKLLAIPAVLLAIAGAAAAILLKRRKNKF
jgi:hypothetical protein